MQKIKLNENDKQNLLKNFEDYLNNTKFTNNKLQYTADILTDTTQKSKAQLIFSPTAYLKMMLYVRDTDSEIAWHGTVTKLDNAYYIEDVMLYPQIISSATVNTDQEKYQNWLIALDDDTANKLRFQGHSHVNFNTNPSSTDLNYYEDILKTLPPNDFYIFMIMNKRGEMTFLIYDLQENLIYETADILVSIANIEDYIDLLTQIEIEKDEYCTKPVPIIPAYTTVSTKNNSMFIDKSPAYYGYKDTDTDDIFTYLDKKYKEKSKRRK